MSGALAPGGLGFTLAVMTRVARHPGRSRRRRLTDSLEELAVDRTQHRHHLSRCRFGGHGIAGKVEILERVGIGSSVAVTELAANTEGLSESSHRWNDVGDLRILREDLQV